MTTFLYKGYNTSGEKVFGSKSYSTEQAMYKHLEELNLSDIEIYKSKTRYKNKQYSLVSPKELSIFCKQLSVMVFSSISLVEGIYLLADQSDNKELKNALTEIGGFLDMGYTFSESISMYEHIFGAYLIQMVSIGEDSGNLDEVFSDMSNYFDKEHEIRKKVKAAVMYPITLSIMMFAIILFLIKSMLPMFDSILISMGAKVSSLTYYIMQVSEFMNKFYLLFIFIIFVVIGAIYIYVSTDKGRYKFDKMKATFPLISFITNRVVTARFSRSMSMLLKSGTDVLSSLDKSIKLIDNKYIYDKLDKANNKIKDGAPVVETIEEMEIFPKLFTKMMNIGEKTGNLDEMLFKATEIFEEEAYDAIDRTTRLIEPILITILTLVIGILLIAIMIPMINIMGSI